METDKIDINEIASRSSLVLIFQIIKIWWLHVEENLISRLADNNCLTRESAISRYVSADCY